MTKKEKLAYLAGIIDGEGTVSINCYNKLKIHTGTRYVAHAPKIDISNSSLEMLEWCRDLVGMPHTLCMKKKYKEHHSQTWTL